MSMWYPTSYLSRSSMAATAEKREERAGDSQAPTPLISRARPCAAFCADSCSGLKVQACSTRQVVQTLFGYITVLLHGLSSDTFVMLSVSLPAGSGKRSC